MPGSCSPVEEKGAPPVHKKGELVKPDGLSDIRDNAIRVVNLVGDGGKVTAEFA